MFLASFLRVNFFLLIFPVAVCMFHVSVVILKRTYSDFICFPVFSFITLLTVWLCPPPSRSVSHIPCVPIYHKVSHHPIYIISLYPISHNEICARILYVIHITRGHYCECPHSVLSYIPPLPPYHDVSRHRTHLLYPINLTLCVSHDIMAGRGRRCSRPQQQLRGSGVLRPRPVAEPADLGQSAEGTPLL